MTAMKISEVRAELGKRVDAAHYAKEHTVITVTGEPRAVLVPYDWYVQQEDQPNE
jgi:prevent-host-death family protein